MNYKNTIQTLVDIINEQRQAQQNLDEPINESNTAALEKERQSLVKKLQSIRQKYGVKPGQALALSQMDELKKKMTPADLKSYTDIANKMAKITLELSKGGRGASSSEKYPLGDRDEKSGRSYSN